MKRTKPWQNQLTDADAAYLNIPADDADAAILAIRRIAASRAAEKGITEYESLAEISQEMTSALQRFAECVAEWASAFVTTLESSDAFTSYREMMKDSRTATE